MAASATLTRSAQEIDSGPFRLFAHLAGVEECLECAPLRVQEDGRVIPLPRTNGDLHLTRGRILQRRHLIYASSGSADRGLNVEEQRVDHLLDLGPCIIAAGLDGEPALEAQLLRQRDCGCEVSPEANVLDGGGERIQKPQPL
jgi:hypothetical protein